MPDHYSPKLFLQQVPNNLRRQFFARRAAFNEVARVI